MQKIFLIRHGETAWNREGRYQGKHDIPLNEEGRRQAQSIAAYLSEPGTLDEVFSSPLARARETAVEIASRHGVQVQYAEGLLEIDFGRWEGRRYTELEAEQKAVAECWFNNPESACIPGGESYNLFQERILEAYRRIVQSSDSRQKAIVTHAGAIRVIVSAVLEMPPQILVRVRLSPASLTVLLYDDRGNPYLELLNGTCHLKDRY